MTATPLQQAVLRLERAIVRLERQPLPAPVRMAVPASDHGPALAAMRDRHDRLRTQVEETIGVLDRLIADGGNG